MMSDQRDIITRDVNIAATLDPGTLEARTLTDGGYMSKSDIDARLETNGE